MVMEKEKSSQITETDDNMAVGCRLWGTGCGVQAVGCRLLLMFGWRKMRTRGNSLPKKKKATSVYARACVHARVDLSDGIQGETKQTKQNCGPQVAMCPWSLKENQVDGFVYHPSTTQCMFLIRNEQKRWRNLSGASLVLCSFHGEVSPSLFSWQSPSLW